MMTSLITLSAFYCTAHKNTLQLTNDGENWCSHRGIGWGLGRCVIAVPQTPKLPSSAKPLKSNQLSWSFPCCKVEDNRISLPARNSRNGDLLNCPLLKEARNWRGDRGQSSSTSSLCSLAGWCQHQASQSGRKRKGINAWKPGDWNWSDQEGFDEDFWEETENESVVSSMLRFLPWKERILCFSVETALEPSNKHPSGPKANPHT